jgi:tryptophan 2,3-dioxygenase
MTDMDYGRYLALDELLRLQRPQTAPEHPDELLFIVVHQASELWFKLILHELETLISAMTARDAMRAVFTMRRINGVMRIVSDQLAALETLPPQRFAQFRGYLGASSGSQSVQFRAVEAACGLRDEHFVAVLREHGEIPAPVAAWFERPTLQQLFLDCVAEAQTTLEELYQGPGPSPLVLLAEDMLEFEQQFARWRFLHVQLVQRVIGPLTAGTGGTLGAKYLERTVRQRFFPALWEVRARLYGGG